MALDWKQTSQWWYARYRTRKGRKLVNLRIKIQGKRPDNIWGKGDEKFRRSRDRAMVKHDMLLTQINKDRDAQGELQELVELKTGRKYTTVSLPGLPNAWAEIPRRRKCGLRYIKQCQSTLTRFVSFIQQHWPEVDEMDLVTREHVLAFMDAESERGVSPKTWNTNFLLLRTCFKELQPNADAFKYYLSRPLTKDEETVFRKPFTASELKAVIDAAQGDDFIRPIIITGMCTAMRRGDCCCLKWSDVDLKQEFLTVKTAKTGGTAIIPVFPMLMHELQAQANNGSKYVFPEQQALYTQNPDGITWRVKKVLLKALQSEEDCAPLPQLSKKETIRKGHDYLARLHDSPKTERMRAVFDAYMKGTKGVLICERLGISTGTELYYLNEIEAAIGCRVVKGRKHPGKAASLKNKTDLLTSERKQGLKRASIRGFHTFRTTWVTLALTAGVSIELVQKVTGQKTADMVRKHYFHPYKEELKKVFMDKMPDLLSGVEQSRDQQMLRIH